MSGDSSSAILGSLLFIGVMPYILVAAAGVAVVAGTVYVASSIVQQAEENRKTQELRKQKEAELKACSQSLKELYGKMSAHVEQMGDRKQQFYQSFISGVEALRLRTKSDIDNINIDSDRDQILSKGGKDCMSFINSSFETQIRASNELFEKEARLQENEFKNYQESLYNFENLQKNQKSEADQKKAMADMLIKDAEDVVRILKTENEVWHGIKSREVEAVENLLRMVSGDYQDHMYEKVIISCRGIIEKGMMLLNDIQREGSRKDLLRTQLMSKYEYLIAWLGNIRFVDMDPNEMYTHGIHEDLNDFSQGKIEALQHAVQERLKRVQSDESYLWNDIMFHESMNECDLTLLPKAERLISAAYGILHNYLKKVDIVEILAPFMEQQGYQADWALNRGNDKSQQLVTHFTSLFSESELSIVIDTDNPVDECSNISFDIHSYEQSGDLSIEMKRETLRNAMTKELHKNNIFMKGPLLCRKHTVHQSSRQLAYNDQEKVAEMQPIKII